MIRYLLSFFFCTHERYTWPQTNKQGVTHVSCLDCGKSLPYNFHALGGAPAQVPTPRTTAPRRYELAKPGLYITEGMLDKVRLERAGFCVVR
jgi:hypothetical protein